ncbi:T9SS type A sorting domain-containing protein [uncultured Psychroserpens sp.]|uniref:T9SS type A sorting domain-containing protein n=1 Tax=uncultured Psychroserpens sp. TaxID=255436 RepID=UPI0026295672|nr:T9SS type A sorting domain-containing protein [uncultured Psychroserpens sp.]
MNIIKFLFFLLCPFLIFGQVQIGGDIDGEAEFDRSGDSVSLSSNGNFLAIGATRNDGNGSLSGHVRIYENQAGVWTQIGNDINGEVSGDLSGNSVSLSSNGLIVAIAAQSNNVNGSSSGHVKVYQYNGIDTWVQMGQNLNGEAQFDEFGSSVKISSNGQIIAIGGRGNDNNGNNSGHVKVYQYNGIDAWVQIGNDINGEASGDLSGSSISLSSDGTIVAIGAPSNNNFVGHVRVYQYDQVDTWVQVGNDIDGIASGDIFGSSVSLSSDGSRVAIGAPESNSVSIQSGQVSIYENQTNNWIQIGQNLNGASDFNFFGADISLALNGNVLAVGAPGNDINGNVLNTGSTSIYRFINNNWTQIGQDIYGEADGDLSGSALMLVSNGSILAVGATENDDSGSGSGHVRVFDLNLILNTEDFELYPFKLYPNPVKNQFTIQLDASVQLKKVSVYNTLGQEVLISEKPIVDTSTLAPGTYIVEVLTNKGKTSKKLIKE